MQTSEQLIDGGADETTVYGPAKPPLPRSADELRATIPGWGADLDPADRPSVPRERYDPGATGAHWEFPERQVERGSRERSIEHRFLTPVFGTAQPLSGPAGAIRRLAYDRFSEGRAAHWLILLLGDRVDAWQAHLGSLLSGRPDNPVTETGVRTEITHHGVAERRSSTRADTRHQVLDPVVVAGPWIGVAVAGVVVLRRLLRWLS